MRTLNLRKERAFPPRIFLRGIFFKMVNKETETQSQDFLFEKERKAMIQKMMSGSKFFEDLHDNEIVNQTYQILTQIYEAEKLNLGPIFATSKEEHIIDQWFKFFHLIPEIDNAETPEFCRLIKRAATAPNAQDGCERANLQYNLAKNDLSSNMGIPMIQACLRIYINGPPLTKFNAQDVRKEWIKNGHKHAEK